MHVLWRLIFWCAAGIGVGWCALVWQSPDVPRAPMLPEKRDGLTVMSLVGALDEQRRGAVLVDVGSQPQNLVVSDAVAARDASFYTRRGNKLILLGGESQWKKWSANIAVVGAVPTPLLRRETGLNARDEVSPAWLQNAWQKRQVRVLDLRESDEWARSHLPNSAQISMFDVGTLRRDQPIALLCLTGHRSAWALKQMRAQGFRNVVSVRGGWIEWKSQGRLLLENATSSTRS